MEKFVYEAKTRDGKSLKGQIEARDEKTAVEILRKKEMIVVKLKPVSKHAGLISGLSKQVKFDQVVNFTRQMATMITAGLPLTNALSILETQPNPAFGTVVSQVLHDVEGGSSLAQAMERHPKVFSPVYTALVKVGEAAGVLDTILKRLARNMEKEREFRGKIKGALVYPAVVMTGMVGVGLVVVLFVIPKMTSMYDDFGADLPTATKILIGISNFALKFWWLVLAGLVGLIAGWRAWVKTPKGRMKFDEIMFKVPIIGPLRTQIIMTEFARTLGLLVASGISVLDGLEIVKKALGSPVFDNALLLTARSVEKGFPLAASLAQDMHFPPIVAQMVSIGEETGKVDEVLNKLARYFEVESEQKVKTLTTAIEPLIMIVLGIGVGFMVIAVILPIYNLTSQF